MDRPLSDASMGKLSFTLALALTAGLIWLITGRGHRQVRQIPEGMGILCPPPGKRYVIYALGALSFLSVLFFGLLYLMDGAPEDARPMWILCAALTVWLLILTLWGGALPNDRAI